MIYIVQEKHGYLVCSVLQEAFTIEDISNRDAIVQGESKKSKRASIGIEENAEKRFNITCDSCKF